MQFIAPTITEMITKENYQRTNAANLKPDNVDINRHPVHVGYVFIYIFLEYCKLHFPNSDTKLYDLG